MKSDVNCRDKDWGGRVEPEWGVAIFEEIWGSMKALCL